MARIFPLLFFTALTFNALAVQVQSYRCRTQLEDSGDPTPVEWFEIKWDSHKQHYQFYYSENSKIIKPRLLLASLVCSFKVMNACDSFKFRSCTSKDVRTLEQWDPSGTPVLFWCQGVNEPIVSLKNSYIPHIKINAIGETKFFTDEVGFNGFGVPGFPMGILTTKMSNSQGSCEVNVIP